MILLSMLMMSIWSFLQDFVNHVSELLNGIYSLYEGTTNIISTFHDINIENEIRKSK